MVLLLLGALSPAAAAATLTHDLVDAGAGTPTDRARLALVDPPDLGAPRVLPTLVGQTVRFEQTYEGLPVLGAAVAMRVLPDGRVPLKASSLAQGIAVDPTPTISLAGALVAADLARYPVHHGSLAVLPMGSGRLVWDIRVLTPDDLLQVLVDAHSGQQLARRSTIRRATGRIYAQNPVRTPETSDVELFSLDPGAVLTGFEGSLQVFNQESGSLYGNDLVGTQVGPSSGEDFLYDPPDSASDAEDGFAQVNAFYHLSAARSYFEALTGEDMGADAWWLAGLTNYHDSSMGGAVDNAAFVDMGQLDGSGEFEGAPNLIFIGQGSKVDFAVDADVFVHESGHYVTKNAIDYNQGQLYYNELGLSPWGGSIDEGISDYFAISLFNDPVLGEAALSPFHAERDLSAQDSHCPEDIVGEVHEDGKLIGELGWALHEAYGPDAADAMMWGATSLLTSDASFADFAAGVRELGAELLDAGEIDSLDPLESALAAGGLDHCEVVQELGTDPLVLKVWGLDVLGSAMGVGCATVAGFGSLQSFFHFKVDTDASDLGLKFKAAVDAAGSGDLSWQLFLREGDPVSFEPGLFLPEVATYDLASDLFTEDSGSVTIEGEDFTPGGSWYGVIVSQSCPNTQVSISAYALGDEGADGAGDDGGNADDGGAPTLKGPGGCACASAARPAVWWLMPLGALLALRRRGERKSPAPPGGLLAQLRW